IKYAIVVLCDEIYQKIELLINEYGLTEESMMKDRIASKLKDLQSTKTQYF
ncbi:hypothetical protein MHK_000375, partial [Candidatus Magnetomorum sp. HK-1]